MHSHALASTGSLAAFAKLLAHEDLNFLATNLIPRQAATRLAGWFTRIETPWIAGLSIAVWKALAPDLNLDEARKRNFRSVHECFTRELRPGARPIDPDPDVIVSPCDAIVGAFGSVRDGQLIQAKGQPYALGDLLDDTALVERYRDGKFATLRLTSSMYHHIHAPCDCRIEGVTYISGDTWNVNPPALRRVEKLFCKNERAVIDLHLASDHSLTLVPVAAILVASIRLNFLPDVLDLRYRGPNAIACNAAFAKGDPLGHFENGSTIVVFASGPLEFAARVTEGTMIRVGEPLFRLSHSDGRGTAHARFADSRS